MHCTPVSHRSLCGAAANVERDVCCAASYLTVTSVTPVATGSRNTRGEPKRAQRNTSAGRLGEWLLRTFA